MLGQRCSLTPPYFPALIAQTQGLKPQGSKNAQDYAEVYREDYLTGTLNTCVIIWGPSIDAVWFVTS